MGDSHRRNMVARYGILFLFVGGLALAAVARPEVDTVQVVPETLVEEPSHQFEDGTEGDNLAEVVSERTTNCLCSTSNNGHNGHWRHCPIPGTLLEETRSVSIEDQLMQEYSLLTNPHIRKKKCLCYLNNRHIWLECPDNTPPPPPPSAEYADQLVPNADDSGEQVFRGSNAEVDVKNYCNSRSTCLGYYAAAGNAYWRGLHAGNRAHFWYTGNLNGMRVWKKTYVNSLVNMADDSGEKVFRGSNAEVAVKNYCNSKSTCLGYYAAAGNAYWRGLHAGSRRDFWYTGNLNGMRVWKKV